jgi:hypothetical protein
MLRLAQPSTGQRVPPAGGAGDGNGSRRPSWSDGWEPRALLAAAGGLYYAAEELAPFQSVDAWLDGRFFWEPIAVALVAVLLILVVTGRQERQRLLGRRIAATSAEPPSELVPICVHCKAVHEDDHTWEPIEAYLAHRTPDKFTRSLCPTCLERLAS